MIENHVPPEGGFPQEKDKIIYKKIMAEKAKKLACP